MAIKDNQKTASSESWELDLNTVSKELKRFTSLREQELRQGNDLFYANVALGHDPDQEEWKRVREEYERLNRERKESQARLVSMLTCLPHLADSQATLSPTQKKIQTLSRAASSRICAMTLSDEIDPDQLNSAMIQIATTQRLALPDEAEGDKREQVYQQAILHLQKIDHEFKPRTRLSARRCLELRDTLKLICNPGSNSLLDMTKVNARELSRTLEEITQATGSKELEYSDDPEEISLVLRVMHICAEAEYTLQNSGLKEAARAAGEAAANSTKGNANRDVAHTQASNLLAAMIQMLPPHQMRWVTHSSYLYLALNMPYRISFSQISKLQPSFKNGYQTPGWTNKQQELANAAMNSLCQTVNSINSNP